MADALVLGTAAVKTLCKLWLKDHDLAATASTTLADLIAAKTSDGRERRKTRLFFENIEEKIADRVQPMLDNEFRTVPDHERRAAVLAVGAALDDARLTEGDLFANDLDPLYLKRHVLDTAPDPTRDLSMGARELFDRLLTVSCSYLVEVLHQLPGFQTTAHAELLSRQSETLALLDKILGRVPTAETRRAEADQRSADFLANYRQQVVSRLDMLELFGIGMPDPLRRYPLSTACLGLTVDDNGALRERLTHRSYRDRSFGPDPADRSGAVSGELRITDALAGTSRLFLRGEAGSGKTTLLQWLAVRAARRDFPDELADWNDTVPFLIRLREHANTEIELPAPEGFLAAVGSNITALMPDGWVHDLLRTGRALVLIDGIDELPDRQRRRARDWLTGLVTDFPDARWVVTSRPAAVAESWLKRGDFDAAELQPMSPADVRRFVARWHRAFQGHADTDVDRCERAVLTALDTRGHLRALAGSPLLCALLCALNLDRRTQLPHDRAELYAAALEMLLERRDAERDVTTGLPLSRTDKVTVLRELAYWLIDNGQTSADRNEAVDQVRRTLAGMPRGRDLSAEVVLDGLLERSGLLREPVVGRIDFVHRTFQEFLAAVAGDKIGALVRNAHDDQWFQVVVLAAGQATERQRDKLVNGLLDRAHTNAPQSRRLEIVAIACLETVSRLDPGLHDRLRELAATVLPPARMSDADKLAAAGDLVLDLLADHPPRNARSAAATIRTARLIGGDAALPVIAGAAGQHDDKAGEELLAAWPYFEADEFARRALRKSVVDNGALRTQGAEQFAATRHLTGLKSLHHSPSGDAGPLTDLAPVRALPKLHSLIIDEAQELRDLTPLTAHPTLEEIQLDGVGSVSVEPPTTLPRLTSLTLKSAAGPRDTAALRDCTRLSRLRLQATTTFDPLAVLPDSGLESFILMAHPEIANLSPLTRPAQLAGLRSLTIWRCPRFTELSGIERWSATLEQITLVDAGLHDLGPLRDMPHLWEIEFNDCTALRNLAPLADLPQLTTLAILGAGTGPVDLTPFTYRTGLLVQVDENQTVLGAEHLGAGSEVIRLPHGEPPSRSD